MIIKRSFYETKFKQNKSYIQKNKQVFYTSDYNVVNLQITYSYFILSFKRSWILINERLLIVF